MILNYNGLRWLHNCLASVIKTDFQNYEIYLIDNGSVDGSVDYVREIFPSVTIIRHKKNLGFAEGYNRALENVGAHYAVLLNNDVEVLSPDWLKVLVRVAERRAETAAVACKMVSMEDRSRLDSVGGMGIPFWRGFVDIGKEEPDRRQYDSEDFEPFAFCGGAALVKKTAFVRAGGFDGRFFLYVEDAELSWRLRLLGYRVGYAPEPKVAHYFSGTRGRKTIDPLKLYYCQRNLLRGIVKNCGSSLGWALRNYLLFSLLMTMGFSVFEPRKTVAVVKAIAWNVLNLKDTYRWRARIQALRRSTDAEILARMFPSIGRYQPAENVTLRRLLNNLFEYSQRRKLQCSTYL